MVDPPQSEARFGPVTRARALMDMGRLDEAVSELRRAVASEPDNADAWCNLAFAEFRRGDHAAALEAADRAAALIGQSDWPHRLRAVSLSRLGRHDEARTAAAEAVRLAPLSPAPHDVATEVALAAGDPRAAQASAERLAELAPDASRSHQLLAAVALRLGRFADAERHARRALELDAENVDAMTDLGVALLARKRKRAAADVLDRAIRLEPSWTRARSLQKAVAQFSAAARIVVICLVVGGVAGLAGLGDPDAHSRAAARVVVGVDAGLLVLAFVIWHVRRHRLPATARAVLREHSRARWRRLRTSKGHYAAGAVTFLCVFTIFGWFTDPESWDAGGWVTMGVIAVVAVVCGRRFLRGRVAG